MAAAPAIAIKHADLGGLTLALALKRAGLDGWQLQEAIAAHTPAPELLPISPNGARVLHALGLRGWLGQHAERPATLEERTGGNGFQLSALPLGEFSANRFGAPFYLVQSLALRDALADALGSTAAPGATTGHSHAPLRVCSRDPVADANAAVPDSTRIRAWLWQGQLPLAQVPDLLRANALSLWVGPGRALWLARDSVSGRLAFTALASRPANASASNSPAPVLATTFGHWHRAIGELLHAAGDCPPRPWTAQPPPEHLARDGAVLVGAAAHPMGPALLQQTSATLEDAWVLSRFAEQHEGAPAQIAEQYQRYRLKRARLLVARSNAAIAGLLYARGGERLRARLTSTLTGRFLPELALGRLDWIYRYDCVRGFE